MCKIELVLVLYKQTSIGQEDVPRRREWRGLLRDLGEREHVPQEEHEEHQDDHEVRGHQSAGLLLLLVEGMNHLLYRGYRVGLDGARRLERGLLDSLCLDKEGLLRVRPFVDEPEEVVGSLREIVEFEHDLLHVGGVAFAAVALGDDAVSLSLVHVAWMTEAQYVFYIDGRKLL